jgi:hypothetical protein
MSTFLGDQAEVNANQHHLIEALAEVREALRRHAGLPEEERSRADVSPVSEAPLALDTLVAAFGLSRFEREILLLCAGVELDSAFADLVAQANGDRALRLPTFGLALAALGNPHWSALVPSGPLRNWRLIEVVGRPEIPLTAAPLRIEESVLHALAGVPHRDERLAGLLLPVAGTELDALVPSHRSLARCVVTAWERPQAGPPPLVELAGPDEIGKRAIAAAATATMGFGLTAVSAADLPSGGPALEGLARLCEREAVLTSSALYIEADALDPSDSRAAGVSRLVERFVGAVFLSTRTRWPAPRRTVLRLDVGKPTAGEQRGLWRALLGPAGSGLNGQIDTLADTFDLTAGAIRSAAVEALARGDEGSALACDVWEAGRAQARPKLDALAERVEPVANWDDLVLPEPERRHLRVIEAQVAHRATVYHDWGFARTGTRGLGLSALFAGASGTGKTMAAEVLAGSLRLDLYRIDLSSVVSKYIGETEKNLRRVFDAAEDGGAILFFDEADALFGKRGEVKDSHDRYANIEINYLLQRMESYRGLAVLATNRKGDLDPAFLRRLRFVVNFPFPDVPQRTRIWKGVFPAQAPTEEIDFDQLARLNIAGGNIRNIALHAAFLAADAGTPVRMAHLLQAARVEFAKMDKPWTPAECGGWR